MSAWFGKNWGAPVCRELPNVPVPVGSLCFYCDEPLVAEDAGMQDGQGKPMHFNCFLRSVIGSVAHLEKRCSCYIDGASEADPPNLTRRQAANAAVAVWRAIQEGQDDRPN